VSNDNPTIRTTLLEIDLSLTLCSMAIEIDGGVILGISTSSNWGTELIVRYVMLTRDS